MPEPTGIYVVTLKEPLPGIPSTVFAFLNPYEADEFASCILSRYPDADILSQEAGSPIEIFPSWSF